MIYFGKYLVALTYKSDIHEMKIYLINYDLEHYDLV